MRYLLLSELLVLHSRLLKQSGGADGIRDMAALESATAQLFATFDGVDLYTSPVEKATAHKHRRWTDDHVCLFPGGGPCHDGKADEAMDWRIVWSEPASEDLNAAANTQGH